MTTHHIDIGPQFHLDFGRFIDFNSYTNTNPFRPANAPPLSSVVVTYDLAAARPDLANDGRHDDLSAYVFGDAVMIYENGYILLKTIPIHPGNGVTVSQVILEGSEDGTTFHVPGSGLVQFQAIGQGAPGTSDTLALTPIGLAADYTQAIVGGTGQYGLSQVAITNYKGNDATDGATVLYSHLNGLSVDMGFTRRDVVFITADSTVPVDLSLSGGNDSVTILTKAWTGNLAQQYTIHGNGGSDSVTFLKPWSAAARIFPPTDSYTIDAHHLIYQTTQSSDWQGDVPPGNVRIDLGHPLRFEVDFDGIEDLEVFQNVNDSANFQVAGIDPNMTVGLHGPVVPDRALVAKSTATYTLASPDHTLDGFLGTLKIDDRAGTGTLVLDDSATNPLVHATSSDAMAATVATTYSVSTGAILRTRSYTYATAAGTRSDASTLRLLGLGSLAGFTLLGGGGSNTYYLYDLPSNSTRIVGGPGPDAFLKSNGSESGDGALLSLVGGGGSDTFRYDDTALNEIVGTGTDIANDLFYTATNTSPTTATFDVADNRTGYWTDYSRAVHSSNAHFTDHMAFDGIKNLVLLGGGSLSAWVNGNTAENLTIAGGTGKNYIGVTAPAPTSPRGALNISGPGNTTVNFNTRTLDFASLQIQAPGGTVWLDDSQSATAHHYVLDQGAISRDAARFAVTALNLNFMGGSGNNAFDLKWSSTLGAMAGASTTLIGGGGNDTFTLAHDVTEGTVGLKRTLDGYLGHLSIDGGAGRNALVVDDSGSLNHPNTYDLASGSFGSAALAVVETYIRNGNSFLSSMDMGTVSFLASRSTATIDVEGVTAGTTLSITANPNASIVMGTPHYVPGPSWTMVNQGNWMDAMAGNVEVHSTGTGPSILMDDSGATAGRHVTIGSNSAGSSITGLGSGRISLIGFKPAKVDIRGGSGDDIYTMLGKLPGLRIDAGSGHDTLDYSNYLTAVAVNLLAGSATDIDRGIAGFEAVIKPGQKK